MGALSPAAVLYDASGNAVGVILDGSIYRLQTEAKITGSLPTGSNNIGDVDLASPLPSGDNNIGNVDLASAIPAGTNEIGKVAQGTKGDGANAWPSVLYDSSGNAVGIILDGAIYRLRTESKIVNSGGTQINPATQDTLAAIKDTDGIKKITDPLPAGDNNIGNIDIASAIPIGTNEIGKVAQGTKGAGSNAWPTSIYNSSGAEVGTADNPLRVDGIGSSGATQKVEGAYPADTINTPNPVVIGGHDTSGSIRKLAVDDQGRIVTSPPSGVSVTAGFEMGYVTTTTSTQAAVRATTYTEPSTNAQRSIASASANDTAAGTGARTVKITYLDQTGAGPYTETVTLNGTTAVNTVATDICFVEQLEVMTVGSGGVNAGIITLYASTGGTGGTVGTMAASDLRTFWAQHYVPAGKTMFITGLSGGHNATTAGGGGIFIIKAKTIGVANVPDAQVSDFIRAYGQASTVTRTYGTAIRIIGPARALMYVAPEGTGTVTYRSAFDYYEE